MEDLATEIIWIATLAFLLLCFGAIVAYMVDLFLNPKIQRKQSYEKIDL